MFLAERSANISRGVKSPQNGAEATLEGVRGESAADCGAGDAERHSRKIGEFVRSEDCRHNLTEQTRMGLLVFISTNEFKYLKTLLKPLVYKCPSIKIII